MFFKKIKNLLKKILVLQTPEIQKLEKNYIYKSFNKKTNVKVSLGQNNNDKTFYIIKRTPGTGFFSNVLFVLNHVIKSKKLGYIPVVDMENFPTIYNERNPILNNFNAWEYYFENFSNHSLNEIYNSKNIIFTSNDFDDEFEKDLISDEIKEEFRNNIIVKKKYLKLVKKIYESRFKGKKTLGVHFRGTSYKRSPGHPMPASKSQMFNIIKKLIMKNKYDMIFLVTEENNYKEFFENKFNDKIFFIKSAFRSDTNNAFKIYPRHLHRYKLGREALIESLLLSHMDGLIYVTSNITSAAIAWNINKKQVRYKIDNGLNSKNIIISQFLWYIKKNLPSLLGGFKF